MKSQSDVNSPAGSVVPACLRGEYTDEEFVHEKRKLVESDERTSMNDMPPPDAQSAADTRIYTRRQQSLVSSVGYSSDYNLPQKKDSEIRTDPIAKEEADPIAKEEADPIAKEEADRLAKEEADRVPACLHGEYTDEEFVDEKRKLVKFFKLAQSTLLETEASPDAAADSHTGESPSEPSFVPYDEIHLDYLADRFLRNGFTYDRLWEVDSERNKWDDVFSYFIASRDSDFKVEKRWLEPRLCGALHDYIAARGPPGAVFRPMLHDTVPRPDSASIGIIDCLKVCGVPTKLLSEYSNSLKGDGKNFAEVQNLEQMMECSRSSLMTMALLVRFAKLRPLYALRLLKLTDEMRRRYGFRQSNEPENRQ